MGSKAKFCGLTVIAVEEYLGELEIVFFVEVELFMAFEVFYFINYNLRKLAELKLFVKSGNSSIFWCLSVGFRFLEYGKKSDFWNQSLLDYFYFRKAINYNF